MSMKLKKTAIIKALQLYISANTINHLAGVAQNYYSFAVHSLDLTHTMNSNTPVGNEH